MFQFRRFPPYTYLIQCMVPEYCSGGFPHSEIPGSMDVCSSPGLFAAYHVFLRLPVPRHSPCALLRLTVFLALDSPTCQRDTLQNCSFTTSFVSLAVIIQFSRCYHTASQLTFPFRKLVGSRLESLNAFMAYTSYNRVSRLSPPLTVGGLKWTRTTDLALIRRAL